MCPERSVTYVSERSQQLGRPEFHAYSDYSVFFRTPAERVVARSPASSESPSSLLDHLGFEALHCFDLLLKVTLGVDLQTDTEPVAPLVGGDLVVDVCLPGRVGRSSGVAPGTLPTSTRLSPA